MNTTTGTDPAGLAASLDETARAISTLLTAEAPAPTGRSYLQPVMGLLTEAPPVVRDLSTRLAPLADPGPTQLPATTATHFALASHLLALGQLTDGLDDFTTAVENICAYAHLPLGPTGTPGQSRSVEDSHPQPGETGEPEYASAEEWAQITAAATAAGLPPQDYAQALRTAVTAAHSIRAICSDAAGALHADAARLRTEPANPGLPTALQALVNTGNAA
jgi:hypothetical protein